MKIISISGLDGSGKSTQIEMLKTYLEKQGKRVSYFHAVGFSLANKLTSFGKEKPAGQAKAITKASSFAVLLRKLFLIIDCWRFKKLSAQLSSQYDYLLTDRYFYDQIVNVHYLQCQTPSFKKPWWQKIAIRCIIKPDAAFYLKTLPEEILKRERSIEQGKDYLNKKEAFYNILAEPFGLTILNGNRGRDEIHNEILHLLHPQLKD